MGWISGYRCALCLAPRHKFPLRGGSSPVGLAGGQSRHGCSGRRVWVVSRVRQRPGRAARLTQPSSRLEEDSCSQRADPRCGGSPSGPGPRPRLWLCGSAESPVLPGEQRHAVRDAEQSVEEILQALGDGIRPDAAPAARQPTVPAADGPVVALQREGGAAEIARRHPAVVDRILPHRAFRRPLSLATPFRRIRTDDHRGGRRVSLCAGPRSCRPRPRPLHRGGRPSHGRRGAPGTGDTRPGHAPSQCPSPPGGRTVRGPRPRTAPEGARRIHEFRSMVYATYRTSAARPGHRCDRGWGATVPAEVHDILFRMAERRP